MKNRLVRVCEVLKREIGVIIRRELEFENTLVTVSDVDITPDLKQAHIFISALGTPAGRRKAMEALENHRVMFQTELSRRVQMKHTPHLNFRLDDAIERGTRVIDIMDELGLKEELPNDENEL
ncbi:MAG: 30S ribosome-binding factor RbfA [Verrucomicrobia bacterium]|jgi:ribosome-binding factor A|nr:30S ribosome-binding factor RbfA [Verrucomicrobiota bacterium]